MLDSPEPTIHSGPVQGEFYWEWDGYFSENTFPTETQAQQDFQQFIRSFNPMATLQRIDQLEGNLSRSQVQQIRQEIIRRGGSLDDYQQALEQAQTSRR